MTRVLHVTGTFPRSATDTSAPFLLDLARLQQRTGWEPGVVALHDGGLPALHDVGGVPVRRARYAPSRWETLAYRGGLVHALPRRLGGQGPQRGLARLLGTLLIPGLMLTLSWATWRETRCRRPTVVHAHWLVPAGLAVALVPRRWRPRTVLTLHGSDVALVTPRLRPLARWIAQRVDEVAAVSAGLAAQAEAAIGLPAGAVHVAPPPLALEVVATTIPAGPRTVIAAGRASHEKGFDVLVAALALPECAEVRATIVTDGPERTALEGQARAAGIEHRVTFRGLVPRAELLELLAAHHVVAVPSRREGLGLLALEALACGRPVVASDVGGLAGTVGEGDGALVSPDDPAALAKALVAVPLTPPVASAVAAVGPDDVTAAHARLYRVAGG
ncbi:MAG: glycosyltransferase, partial [Actinomycetota bacterium]|nr:glycosyltransferase [Actinomycetota bacterium]